MKRIVSVLLFIIFVVNISVCMAQDPFGRGYQNGYKAGYAYAGTENGEITTWVPLIPMAPLPSIRESSFSYQDGYNRGYIDGYKAYFDKTGSAPSVAGGKMLHEYPDVPTMDANKLLQLIIAAQANQNNWYRSRGETNRYAQYYYNPSLPRNTRMYMLDLSYGIGQIQGPTANITFSFNCVEEYLKIGFGFGFSYLYDWIPENVYDEFEPINMYSVPAFLDIRSYFLKTRISPFYAQRIGYAFLFTKDYSDSGYIFSPGFYSDSSLGIRCLTKGLCAISLSTGYTFQRTSEESLGLYNHMDKWLKGFNFKVSIEW